MNDWIKLRDQLKNATGPDRELDYALFRAFDMPLPKRYGDPEWTYVGNGLFRCHIPDRESKTFHTDVWPCPAFTGSNDAIIGLVRDKCPDTLWLIRTFADGSCLANIWRKGFSPNEGHAYWKTEAPTTPLALCQSAVNYTISGHQEGIERDSED